MKAGVVVYRREGHQLVGQWSHADIGGALAREIVRDVPDGLYEGDWPVEIFLPDEQLFFTGRLRSVALGACVRLAWEGVFLKSGKPGRFEGIGCASDPNLLSATFEEIAVEL